MCMHTLQDIKRLRKKHHLTQKILAEKAEISQSLLAKIEAGTVEPSYTRALQIFTVLQEIENTSSLTASEVMQKKVVCVKPKDALKKVVLLMKKQGISQLPVLEHNRVIGLVTESIILRKLLDSPYHNIKTVQEIMEEVPPIIGPKTKMHPVMELLKDSAIVLIASKGNIIGLITKTDLLERIADLR
jgi:predicted transcriptional regulator